MTDDWAMNDWTLKDWIIAFTPGLNLIYALRDKRRFEESLSKSHAKMAGDSLCALIDEAQVKRWGELRDAALEAGDTETAQEYDVKITQMAEYYIQRIK